MTYAIVYASRTGNTRRLGEAIREALPAAQCLHCGAPDPKALEADVLYVGFWTDKGTCPQEIGDFLAQVTDQKVFLFGTAGFGGAPAYFDQILGRVREHLAPAAQVIGTFMCQGQMPQAVKDRYEAMEPSPRREAMLENFQKALGHPDARDTAALQAAVKAAMA